MYGDGGWEEEEEGRERVSGHSRNCIPHRFTHPEFFGGGVGGWDRFNKGTKFLNTIISAVPLAWIRRFGKMGRSRRVFLGVLSGGWIRIV